MNKGDQEEAFGRRAGESIIRNARAHQIADQLIGTAQTLHQVMSCEEIEDPDLMSELRDLMFECDCCGWWHSIDELHNEPGQEFEQECDECHDCCEHED